MNQLAANSQRLRTLENHIRECAETIQKNGIEIGHDLCEIRDDKLWKSGYESWDQYLKERAKELVGRSFAQAAKLVQAAEIQKRIPDSVSSARLTPSHLNELGRLAPSRNGTPSHRDYSALRPKVVASVVERATENAEKETPTVSEMRKAVDVELGIDRGKEAKKRNAEMRKIAEEIKENQRETEERERQLWVYLLNAQMAMESWIEQLENVTAEGWKFLDKEHRGVAFAFFREARKLADMDPNAKSNKPAESRWAPAQEPEPTPAITLKGNQPMTLPEMTEATDDLDRIIAMTDQAAKELMTP
jgi:hypothetical protein